MSKPDMGSIIHIKNQSNILVIGNYYVNYQTYQNLMLLTYSDTKRTLMHLLLFTNSAQRELVSICTQSIHNRNWLSLPYILALYYALIHPYFLCSPPVYSSTSPRNLNLIFQLQKRWTRILAGGKYNAYTEGAIIWCYIRYR